MILLVQRQERIAREKLKVTLALAGVQGLSNILWAFAKLERPVPALLGRAAAEVIRQINDFNVRDMSEVLWAFAKLEHLNCAGLAEAVAARTAHIMNTGGEHCMPGSPAAIHLVRQHTRMGETVCSVMRVCRQQHCWHCQVVQLLI